MTTMVADFSRYIVGSGSPGKFWSAQNSPVILTTGFIRVRSNFSNTARIKSSCFRREPPKQNCDTTAFVRSEGSPRESEFCSGVELMDEREAGNLVTFLHTMERRKAGREVRSTDSRLRTDATRVPEDRASENELFHENLMQLGAKPDT